ncbi:MAG: hypothetical protein ACREH8_03880 [Opitutaceae bacterium]
MFLSPLDLVIVAGYMLLSLAIGIVASRTAGRNSTEYLGPGRIGCNWK